MKRLFRAWVLPAPWWKLSWLWFSHLRARAPGVKSGFFRTSLSVAVLSLSLGVAALSLTLAVVTGFEWTVAEAISRHQGHAVHVLRKWMSYGELEAFLDSAPKPWVRAEFFWNSQGLVLGPQGGRGVLIEGRMDAAKWSEPLQAAPDRVAVELGSALARHLGVQVGSELAVSLPGLLKGQIPTRVSAVVSRGMYEFDSRMLRVNDSELRAYLKDRAPEAWASRPGDAHGVRFFFEDSYSRPNKYPSLERWMDSYRSGVEALDPGWEHHRVFGWKDQESSLFASIRHDRRQLAMILSLLTLVAALNVAATLVVLFLERDREMAMLQALGLGPAQLRVWMTSQGLFLGLASSTLGVLLGLGAGSLLVRMPFAQLPPEIYNLSHLDLGYDWREQLSVFAFGVLAAMLAAFLIGWNLSRSRLLQVLGSRR
jgi:lipoprotein-releasing system permease protein